MGNSPLVSIVIINWNGGQIFKDCLESLVKVKYPKIELIVVDNASEDQSENFPLKYKRFKQTRIIKNESNLGFAEANNQGVKYAKGKYILLLNNDTRVEKDFLSKLVSRIEKDSSIAVIQPKIFLMHENGYLDNAGSYLTKIGFLKHWGFMERDGPEFNKEREIFSAKGACMLIRKQVVDEVGLFDPKFVSYFEESDFCWRVWLANYRILFYPQAIIYHKLGFTIRRLNAVKLNYHYYKNRIRSLIKNLEANNLLFVLVPHIIISLGILAVFLLRFKFRNAQMIIFALLWNLYNLPNTLIQRQIIQSTRKVNDEFLFKNLSEKINWLKYWNDLKRIEEDSART